MASLSEEQCILKSTVLTPQKASKTENSVRNNGTGKVHSRFLTLEKNPTFYSQVLLKD